MKLWLNHILACPNDKNYPLKLKIFKWDTPDEDFKKILNAYEKKLFINYKDPKNPMKIQTFRKKNSEENVKIGSQKVHAENKRLTNDIHFKNIINFSKEKDRILINDYNNVSPAPIKEYIKYYVDSLDEFEIINDLSENIVAIQILELTKTSIRDKINKFFKDINSHESTVINKKEIADIYDFLEPIVQDLLFLNYYFFLLEIDEGVLMCDKCKQWFSIINTIPRLFPIHMKRDELDLNFKNKWIERFPKEVV